MSLPSSSFSKVGLTLPHPGQLPFSNYLYEDLNGRTSQSQAYVRYWTEAEEWDCKHIQTVNLFGTSFLYSRELCACRIERRVIIGSCRSPSVQVHKMLNRARCPAAQSIAPRASDPSLTPGRMQRDMRSSWTEKRETAATPFSSFPILGSTSESAS